MITEPITALADHASASSSLFNDIKLLVAVVTPGMITLGLYTKYPKLPQDSLQKFYSQERRARCANIDRLHVFCV